MSLCVVSCDEQERGGRGGVDKIYSFGHLRKYFKALTGSIYFINYSADKLRERGGGVSVTVIIQLSLYFAVF